MNNLNEGMNPNKFNSDDALKHLIQKGWTFSHASRDDHTILPDNYQLNYCSSGNRIGRDRKREEGGAGRASERGWVGYVRIKSYGTVHGW